MNKEQIYEAIRTWEYTAGESFFDYNERMVYVPCFMFWCFGKGYITQEQINLFAADFESEHSEYYLDGIISGDNEGFALIEYCEDNEEFEKRYSTSMMIVAEFLSLTDLYQKRFKTSLIEHDGFSSDILHWFSEELQKAIKE